MLSSAPRACFNGAVFRATDFASPDTTRSGPLGSSFTFALALALALAPACSEAGPEPVPPLRLTQVRPRPEQREGLFLNEALVFHFSAPVEAASVSSESLSVRGPGGLAARGRFEIEGDRVRFLPELGLARDLSDGGLLPGTRYEVLVRGFPWPDGLRSVDGRVLERTQRFEVETAPLREPRGQMFEDRSPLYGEPLVPEARELDPGASIYLRCAEPLDPGTVADGEFSLRSREDLSIEIPLDARLVQNDAELGARLELRPRRRLASGVYDLPWDLEVGLRDFGGNDVWSSSFQSSLAFVVRERSEARTAEYQSFLKTDLSLPIRVPGCDGTARWAGDGRVTVGLPAAAGRGSAGPVVLGSTEGRRDVEALRLELPAHETCELLSVPSLVVLRSQGLMRISGTLRRRAGEGPSIVDAPGQPFSEWLETTREFDPPWTVLIAGGDLILEGSVDVDGPLLLAAGGRLRITGSARSQAGELWLVGEGGGPRIVTYARSRMVLDPPFENPLLVENFDEPGEAPLTFALVSGPMPPEGGVSRWIGAEVEAEDRGGRVRVRYLPEDFPIRAPMEEWGIVEDPSELLSADALRLLIELELAPPGPARGRTWDPPLLDEVRLFWEGGRR